MGAEVKFELVKAATVLIPEAVAKPIVVLEFVQLYVVFKTLPVNVVAATAMLLHL